MTDSARRDDDRELAGLQRRTLIGGAVAAVVAAILAFLDPDAFFRSYLLAFVFWVGISLGCLSLRALHQLSGGAWGFVGRRIFEAGARTLPLMALLFLPLILGFGSLYEWSHADVVAADPLLQHKEPWLNIPFFLIRTAIYFAIWIFVAYRLISRGRRAEELADPAEDRRVRTFAGFGLILTLLAVTFAAFDWLMSLNPHWFSSIFGAVVAVGFGVAAFAFTVIVLRMLEHREPLDEVAVPPIFNDYGSLMLAFIMIWAYLQLSQYLIIWSGNIPEEVTWFLDRSEGIWAIISPALVIFHFVVPFVFLLARRTRTRSRNLALLSGLLLLVHYVDLLWLIKPNFHDGAAIHPLDIITPLAMGGLWLAFFFWNLKQHSLVPLPELPRLREQLEHVH